MLNKIFYYIRIITILYIGIINFHCHAYAQITDVFYGNEKVFNITPGLTYAISVIGVGIPISTDEIKWNEWDNKNACRITSELYNNGLNKKEDIIYKKQIIYPQTYTSTTEQQIIFRFYKTNPDQPKGTFCRIKIIAYDIPNKSTSEFLSYDSTVEYNNNLITGYGNNDEADYGCCYCKKRSYGL